MCREITLPGYRRLGGEVGTGRKEQRDERWRDVKDEVGRIDCGTIGRKSRIYVEALIAPPTLGSAPAREFAMPLQMYMTQHIYIDAS